MAADDHATDFYLVAASPYRLPFGSDLSTVSSLVIGIYRLADQVQCVKIWGRIKGPHASSDRLGADFRGISHGWIVDDSWAVYRRRILRVAGMTEY